MDCIVNLPIHLANRRMKLLCKRSIAGNEPYAIGPFALCQHLSAALLPTKIVVTRRIEKEKFYNLQQMLCACSVCSVQENIH